MGLVPGGSDGPGGNLLEGTDTPTYRVPGPRYVSRETLG